MSDKLRNVKVRHGTSYYRKVVPPELREAVGKTELLIPLGSTPSEVRQNHEAAQREAVRLLDEARAGQTPVHRPADEVWAEFHQEKLLQITARLNPSPLDRSARSAFIRQDDELRRILLRRVALGAAPLDEAMATIGYSLDALIEDGAVPAPTNNEERLAVLTQLAHAELKARHEYDVRAAGGTVSPTIPVSAGGDTATVAPFAVASAPSRSSASASAPVTGVCSSRTRSPLPLLEVLERQQREQSVNDRTFQERLVAIRMLEECIGPVADSDAVTEDDLLHFREMLRRAPANYVQRFPGLTLPEAVEANDGLTVRYPLLSSTTIRKKWFAHIKGLFAFAREERLISHDPSANLKGSTRGKKGAKKSSRKPFDDTELQLIFGAPLFHEPVWGERQWGLLLAAYTGARCPSETGKALATEVVDIEGIPCVRFRGTKTEVSDYSVPIHERLLKLGFMDYVTQQRRTPHGRLFPKWAESDHLNRWFNRTFLREQLGITDRSKTMHSFRHTLTTRLQEAGAAPSLVNRIIPREDDGMGTIGVYTHLSDTSLIEERLAALNRVVLEDIDLAGR